MTWGETLTWKYLSNSNVNPSSNKIRIPEEVYEVGILRHPSELIDGDPYDEESDASPIGRAHWSFDSATGWVILSDRPLDQAKDIQEGLLVEGQLKTTRYKPKEQDAYKQGDSIQGYRVTIPNEFFDSSERGFPESVRFKHGEERHFVTAEEFLQDDPTPAKSCYVLRRDQLETLMRQITDRDDISADRIADIPHFFS